MASLTVSVAPSQKFTIIPYGRMMHYETIEKDIAEGRLWRAKEALQGRLASHDFDTELMRRYGEVLLLMGDKIEAGRYLFCAGAREPDHAEAIELFLSRNRQDNRSQFMSRLPSMVRRQRKLATFVVSPEFERNGWTPESLRQVELRAPSRSKTPSFRNPRSRLRRWADAALQLALLGLLFISMAIGFLTIVSTIAREAWSILFR